MLNLPMYLKLAHITYHGMQEQARTGICFDSPRAEELIVEISEKMERIEQEVEPQLPARKPLKGELKVMTPPKLQFRKDGTPSANCEKWFDDVFEKDDGSWGAWKGEWLLTLPYHKPVIQDMPMTLGNGDALKDWLLSLGWQPMYWNYKTKKNKNGKLEKVRVNRKFVKTSPKLQENGKICPNLSLLEEVRLVKPILEWLTLRHRRSQIQGWLNNPRLEVDGRLSAGASGLTNTKRQKHITVVNVPRVGSVLGEEMRGLFIVPEGMVQVGYDASSLEDRVKAHYLTRIDNGEFAEKILAGNYDPHTENADIWFPEEVDRGKARTRSKNGGYALQYQCMPPTLAKTLKCSLHEAEEYHRLYWEHNWALAEFIKQVERAWESNNKSFVRTIDHSKIYTRHQHSVSNCVMQSTGAKVMDMSYAFMRKWVDFPAERVIYSHDEYQWYTYPEYADKLGELGCESIRAAGRAFKMQVPMDAEFMVGKSWAECH